MPLLFDAASLLQIPPLLRSSGLALACALAIAGPAAAQVPGSVYVIDSSARSAVRLDPALNPSQNQTLISEDGLITNPSDIAIGNGAIYFSDLTQDGIIRVDLATQQQTRVDANGPSGPITFNPNGLAVDSQGNIIVAVGIPFFTILLLDTTSGLVFGLTPGIGWGAPGEVALGPNGELYVIDGPFVWLVDVDNQTREIVGQVGDGAGFAVNHNTGLLYVATGPSTFVDDAIVEIDPTAYDPNDFDANKVVISEDSLLNNPLDAAVLPDGDIVVANGSGTADEILRIDVQTGVASVIGTGGDLLLPKGVAVPVPEPAAAYLQTFGLAMIAMLRRMRRVQ